MAMWDKLFNKKDEASTKLNPIVQKSPPPAAAPRVSAARPVPRPAPVAASQAPAPPKAEATPMAKPEGETKKRKKSESGTKTRTRATDDQALLKRGMLRQSQGDHDGAIVDFGKAIELNPNLVQAYASRGVSREAKGDAGGAKSDYSKSIQIEIMNEINRQMRDNPEVET